MLIDEYEIRPRYGEVDQMGYVYHANYVTYCHQARTELLRKIGLQDNLLEENNVMMPVISFNIEYKKPIRYDEIITLRTYVKKVPQVRFKFEFEILNKDRDIASIARSTVVFVTKDQRIPIPIPDFIKEGLEKNFDKVLI